MGILEGELTVRKLLKLIRGNCLNCAGERGGKAYKIVRECGIEHCPFWSLRFGMAPTTAAEQGKNVGV